MTCEGSGEPEVRTKPDEVALPLLFSSNKVASPSMYSKATLLVFGNRWPGSPVTKQFGTAGGSTTVAMISLRSGWAFSADKMAVESDPVPREAKTISESCSVPTSFGTCWLAFLIAWPTWSPNR